MTIRHSWSPNLPSADRAISNWHPQDWSSEEVMWDYQAEKKIQQETVNMEGMKQALN